MLAVTVLGSSATMLAATSVNLALPSLAADLGADSSQQQWVVNAYLLAMASFILLGGSLGDHYGRVAVYRHSRRRPGVGCRCLVRAGCGRPRHRPRDRGLLVTMSRRLVYVVNIFLVVAVAVFSSRVPETRDPRARGEPIDFSGAAATVVLLGCSSYLLINASDLAFGVREYAVLAAVVVAAAAAAAVVLWHIEPNRPHAMVPLDLFADRRFVAANVVTLLLYAGLGLMFFLVSLQLQVSAGWSAFTAGLALVPVMVILLVLSPTAGSLAARYEPRWLLTFGSLLMAVGLAMLSSIDGDSMYLSDVLGPVSVAGLGLVAVVAPVTSAALDSVPATRAGAASAANNAVARTGLLFAVAAVPLVVGLSGDALLIPEELTAGYRPAMLIAAALTALAGLAAAVLIRPVIVTPDAIGAELRP